MLWSALAFAALAEAQGLLGGLNHLRFGCSQITIERLDPLVNPGVVGTPHMHQVVGGNAFNASMPDGQDISKLATCTTCGPADDLSNYWTANLYFKARNGTFKRVPQVPNRYALSEIPVSNLRTGCRPIRSMGCRCWGSSHQGYRSTNAGTHQVPVQ